MHGMPFSAQNSSFCMTVGAKPRGDTGSMYMMANGLCRNASQSAGDDARHLQEPACRGEVQRGIDNGLRGVARHGKKVVQLGGSGPLVRGDAAAHHKIDMRQGIADTRELPTSARSAGRR